jgi:ABC-type ATPase with predicted acetyltransferase domain
MVPMTSLAIETHGLGKRFGERAALKSIDLEVPHGCAFGFLGRNGAGKTTLVRLLLGHDLPSGRPEALAQVGAIVDIPSRSWLPSWWPGSPCRSRRRTSCSRSSRCISSPRDACCG